ncbi:MAG: rhodanese-like domain-containing protein [Acidobacteriota bacterium]
MPASNNGHVSLFSKLFWWLPFGAVPEVTARALSTSLKANAGRPQILDVRTRDEWKGGHIKGSVNIPITELRARLEELDFDPAKPVVAICLSGHRSRPAVRLLQISGYQDIRQLSGGMIAWRGLRLPEKNGG